ncbi:hypothetical protein [Candidatus Clostridium stratigraminis]|uniref:Uncharacterized protein n=1 Tax=Candidatus Clostridium stratigraminis TaxID=3381661 RepID=A0ABW8T5G4_9CLOT
MSEEIKREVFNNETIDNTEIEKENNSSNTDVKGEKNITSNELKEPKHEDVSKVKICTILKQRFKNSSPFFKRAIPLIIVAIVCFGAGLIAGREIDRHNMGRVTINRKGMFKQMPNGKFNGGNFNMRPFNNNNNNSNNNNQKNAVPPSSNSQPQ